MRWWWWCLGMLGCALPGAAGEPPSADAAFFEAEVYPLLLRDCGFPACHGTEGRFFAIYGPGRARLDPETGVYDPVTPVELALTYDRARSTLSLPAAESPLLRKPLSVRAGGAGHRGDDDWGRALFESVDDPRYRTLARWAGLE